eukprot:COSAG01_NODE_70790_length_257_cov_1.930380_1_plen_34_part_01
MVALPQRQPAVWTHGASMCGVHDLKTQASSSSSS